MSQSATLSSLFASEIIALVSQKISYICTAPGSRNSALVLAADDHPDITTSVHIDERGLGFFALGIAKATRKPVGIIVTSGTAVANLLPAVIEASQTATPLLILSADRPEKLVGTGANQTIIQPGLFGQYVQAELNIAPPTSEFLPPLSKVHSVLSTWTPAPRRPIHINCQFEDPHDSDDPSIGELKFHRFETDDGISKQAIEDSIVDLQVPIDRINAQQGWIIIGDCAPSDSAAIDHLVQTLNWPVITDITSGCRALTLTNEITNPQWLIEAVRAKLIDPPDQIVWIGGSVVSKSVFNLPKQLSVPVIQFQSPGRPFDPTNSVTHCTIGNLTKVLSQITPKLHTAAPHFALIDINAQIQAAVSQFAKDHQDLTTSKAISELMPLFKPESLLFLGNSLPIRLADRYAHQFEATVITNRGASGIDGLMATASGAAYGSKKPTTVLLGDLSFLHDLNSLLLVAKSSTPMTVVVFNNHGGGIFDQLPIANHSAFETYFKTPQNFDARHLCDGFGVSHHRVETHTELIHWVTKYSQKAETKLLEIRVSSESDLAYQNQVEGIIQSVLKTRTTTPQTPASSL